MPLPQPNLDDRTYQQLVEEAISAIPQLAPRWTDHNAHDPGITLIELFAWLAEMQQYYLNRERSESVLKFLKLLGSPPRPAKPAQCQLSFRSGAAHPPGACEHRHDRPAPATVTVVVAPFSLAPRPIPSPNFLKAVKRHLQRRRLITTKVHVIAPLYTRLRVEAEVRMLPGFDADEVGRRIHPDLDDFYHPLTGGEGGKGWPFGRPVYKSEAYQRIDQVEGVDCVERLDLAAGGAGVSRDAQGNVLLPLQGMVFTGRHQIEMLAAAS